MMIPANRWGNSTHSATTPKIIQEVVALTVFCGHATVYLSERVRWKHVAAFGRFLAGRVSHFCQRND